MANLRARRRSDDEDRGQLLLVTGLAIAFAIVAIVLLLNTAIYTQNLASRNPSPGADEALQYRQEVVDGTGGVLDHENFDEYASRSTLETNVRDGIHQHQKLLKHQYAERGTSVSNSSVTFTDGKLVRQTDSTRDFTVPTVAGDQEDWTVVSNAEDVRAFEMTVKDDRLEAADEDDPDDVSDLDDTFRVRVIGATTQWQLFVYENSTGAINVAVKNGTDAPDRACGRDLNEVTVSLSNGSIAGDDCPAIRWAKGVSGSYVVRYEHGTNVEGTYEFVVGPNGASGINANVNSGPGGPSPYAVPAVYSADFDLTYQSTDVTYEATLTVAPGEPDD